MELDKIRKNKSSTIRKINYSQFILFNKFKFKGNNVLNSESNSKKVNFEGKNNEKKNNEILKEKEKKVKELQEQLEKEKGERYKFELKFINLQREYEKNKLFEEQNRNKNFLEKSEICDYWNKFANNDINNFIDFEEDPFIFHFLISEFFCLCSNLIKDFLYQKYNKLLLSLNLPISQNGLYQISKTLKPFILDNISVIVFNEQENEIFLEKFKKIYKENYIKNINEKIDEFNDIINDNSFKVMLNNVKNLTLFAFFNEPILYFDIEKEVNKRKIEIIKVNNNIDKYIIVNYDGNNEFEGIILLNPPLTKSGNVISILSDLKKVILKCNKEQICKIKEKENYILFKNNNYICNNNNNKHSKSNNNIYKINYRNPIREIKEEFENTENFLLFNKTKSNSHPSLNLYNSKSQFVNDYTHNTSNEETNYFNTNNYFFTVIESDNKKELKISYDQNIYKSERNDTLKEKTFLNPKTICVKKPFSKTQIETLGNRKLIKIFKFQMKKKYTKHEKRNKDIIPDKILLFLKPKNKKKNNEIIKNINLQKIEKIKKLKSHNLKLSLYNCLLSLKNSETKNNKNHKANKKKNNSKNNNIQNIKLINIKTLTTKKRSKSNKKPNIDYITFFLNDLERSNLKITEENLSHNQIKLKDKFKFENEDDIDINNSKNENLKCKVVKIKSNNNNKENVIHNYIKINTISNNYNKNKK